MNRIIGVDYGNSNSAVVIRQGIYSTSVPRRSPLASLAMKSLKTGEIVYADESASDEDDLLRNAKRTLLWHRESYTTLTWLAEEHGTFTKQFAYDPQNEINVIEHQKDGWRVERHLHLNNPEITESNVEEAERAAIVILRELKSATDQTLGRPMDSDDQFIFAVPAESYHYRTLLKSLAHHAGWPIDSSNFVVFPEPYAVILDICSDTPQPGTYLVVDAGGATTDWAIVSVSLDEHHELQFRLEDSYRHDMAGSRIDELLAKRVAPSHVANHADLHRIEREKIRLSQRGPGSQSIITLNGMQHDITWQDVHATTVEVFDPIFQAGVERFLSPGRPTHFVIAGGASQSPGFKELAAKYFNSLSHEVGAREISFSCARGLTRALDHQVLSGLDQDLSWVEYPSQKHSRWVRAFDSIPEHSHQHIKRFQFTARPYHIPLFLGQDEDLKPAGYLRVPNDDIRIWPVWKNHSLHFESEASEPIEWISAPFPYLRLHMAIHWEHNQLAHQRDAGYGQITGFKNNLTEWVGPTEGIYATIHTGGASQVKVKTSTAYWHTLNIQQISFIEPNQFPHLPSSPLDLVEFGPFQEVTPTSLGMAVTQNPVASDERIPKPRPRFGPIPVFSVLQRTNRLEGDIERLARWIEKLSP